VVLAVNFRKFLKNRNVRARKVKASGTVGEYYYCMIVNRTAAYPYLVVTSII